MDDKLTIRQEKFVNELIKGKSQREAYRAAFSTKTAKDSTIDTKACELFGRDKIKSRFNELRDKVVKRAEDNAIITAEEVLRGIAAIARGNINNYLEYRTEKVFVGYDLEGNPVQDYRQIIVLKDSNDVDTSNISEVSISDKGTFTFKQYGKDKALYKLADIMGLDTTQKERLKIEKSRLQLDKARLEHEKSKDNRGGGDGTQTGIAYLAPVIEVSDDDDDTEGGVTIGRT